jgi:hypothetical protein
MRRAAFLLLLLLIGCNDNSGRSHGGGGGDDAGPGDVCPTTGTPRTAELCNQADDDCDGHIDEDFDLAGDPKNCGACGHACAFGNAVAACVNGTCAFSGCPEGTADANGDPGDGCEARCALVPGPETCDGADNDCDGKIDEDFDLTVDTDHCGACGHACHYDRGEALCEGGACRLARCDAGWGDLNGVPGDGCEARCEPAHPGPEVCDGEDNDCDGKVDEGFDLASDGENCGACGNRCAYANGAGRCDDRQCALARCEPGYVDADHRADNGCESRCQPTNGGVEVCDEIDDDCNGVVDDGVDKDRDPQNCGGCGALDEAYICRLPNAENACDHGRCAIARCEPGFADADHAPDNGCEAPCEPTGDEVCDGIDNDCDGDTDEGFDLGTDVNNCGGCGNVCHTGNAEPACLLGRCAIRACPAGMVDADHDPRDGCEYACVPAADPTEICDGVDDDCDGSVDEGFDILSDLDHCGGCDQPCHPDHALALCNAGACEIGGCDDGWVDANGDVGDGCELNCTPSDDGLEVCDGRDNDCDGSADEDFDLQTDPLHCGACDHACSFPNGRVECQAGQCARRGCQDGWFDADGQPDDGCEYRCTPTPDPREVCDGVDNDCNGTVDDGFDLMSSLDHCGACDTPCRRDHATTACDQGTCRLTACVPGFADANHDPRDGCEAPCAGAPGDPEVCDGLDNDCDGHADEDFDLATDADHCGECGHACDVPNAEPLCNGGQCNVRRCDPGFVDLDGRPGNGCECRLTNGGVEICDGLDNDCNGVVDDPGRVAPPPDFGCRDLGVCAGTHPACADGRWTCPYPATYQVDETRCDDLDNDCDGERDEGFAGLGRPCTEGVGACAETGALRCNPAGDGTECSAAAHPERARAETCNDRDDDCDGRVDEDSQALVRVPAGNGVPAFTMFAYEASRPDADGATAGQSFARACSKSGALPWADVDYATALAACRAANMTLCGAVQWQRACEAGAHDPYPYGALYDAARCNGQDYDPDPGVAGNQDRAIPTGSLATCRRSWGNAGAIYDLSGNLWEWTTEDVSPAGDGSARALRGGSYGNVAGGLTCQFEYATPVDAARENVGFRCCAP